MSVVFGRNTEVVPGSGGAARIAFGRWIRYGWRVLSFPVQALVSLMPRSPNVWVFGSWFGERFADNPKYLYLHAAQHRPDVRAIWLTRRPEVVKEVRAIGGEAYHTLSLLGALWRLRAGVVIVSVGIQDVGSVLTSGAAIVQTFHGIPLKHIGMDDRRFHARPPGLMRAVWSLRNFMLRREWNSYSIVLATSAETRRRYAAAFGVPAERIPVLGYPRNDMLADDEARGSLRAEVFEALGVAETDASRIVAYLPTHRDAGRGTLTLFPFPRYDEAELDAFLERADALLVYKRHFYHGVPPTGHGNGSRARIIDGTQSLPDVQPLLACADVLVTDLSSCFFDFLLRDRPIVFVTREIEEFVSGERGLYYPYEQVTPGPHAASFTEFLDALQRSLSHPELDQEWREEVRKVFHAYGDTRSAQRVFEYVRSLAKGKSNSHASQGHLEERDPDQALGVL